MNENRVHVLNLSNFFNRELFMYSLGDIRFKKPIALKKVGYITGFLIIWALPMFLTFGIPTGPFMAAFMFGVPIAAGHYGSKPVFGGKGLIDFTKTLFNYLGEPKGWTDLNSNNSRGEDNYYIEQEIWISRRRELNLLNRGNK